jgi:RNA polymerase sigma-70 factor (ECF subfamily)
MARPFWLHSAGVLTTTSADSVATPRELSLEAIHERHVDFVWCSLQRLGVQKPDLEDALQEVFIVVHAKLSTFDGSSRLSTWLFGICLRVASGQRRKAYRHREHSVTNLEETAGAVATPSAEAALLEREALQNLETVLGALDLERRAVFVMFEVEGIGCPEIATLLGLPLGTVYSRLAAARADFSKAALRLRKQQEWSERR